MKTDDINNVRPRLQTINECLRVPPEACPAHSNGEPDAPSTTNNIGVRFAHDSLLQLQIKHAMKTTPFADLMRHPEKLEAALKAAKNENDAFAASRMFGRSETASAKQNMPFKNDGAYSLMR
jgi:hypothetical protein